MFSKENGGKEVSKRFFQVLPFETTSGLEDEFRINDCVRIHSRKRGISENFSRFGKILAFFEENGNHYAILQTIVHATRIDSKLDKNELFLTNNTNICEIEKLAEKLNVESNNEGKLTQYFMNRYYDAESREITTKEPSIDQKIQMVSLFLRASRKRSLIPSKESESNKKIFTNSSNTKKVSSSVSPKEKKQKLKVSEVRKIQQIEKIIKKSPSIKSSLPKVQINVDEQRTIEWAGEPNETGEYEEVKISGIGSVFIGDCIYARNSESDPEPYIGKVRRFFEKRGKKMVEIRWFYRKYDLVAYNLEGQAPYEQEFHPKEIVASDVTDCNEVDVIVGLCNVTYIVDPQQENSIKDHFGKDSFFCKKVLRTESAPNFKLIDIPLHAKKIVDGSQSV